MATPAQAAASRANGALSNGPTSVAGKAISSRNSFRLGIDAESMIIPGEDPAELERITAEYHDRYQPVGPDENAVLTEAIRAQWLRARYYRIETQVINMRAAAHPDPKHAVAAAFDQDAKSGNTLQRLFRRQKAADKDWSNAIERLERFQRLRRLAVLEEQMFARPSAVQFPGLHPAATDSRVRSVEQPLRPSQPAHRPVETPVNLGGPTVLGAGSAL